MNIYNIPLKPHSDEYFETLFEKHGVKIEKIVSYGVHSPENYWYDQNEDEWVTVLDGWAELEYIDGKKKLMEKGSSVHLPAGEKHRVSKVSNPCVWLAVRF